MIPSPNTPPGPTNASINQMRERITDEIFNALGLSRDGTLRQLFGWLFRAPTQRFARIFAAADEAVGRGGMPAGCASVVSDLGISVAARGLENIPAEGPVIVASNHPGAYDSVALGSCMQHRKDLRIIALETALYRAMPHSNTRFIYATDDPPGRMLTLRTAIQHLQAGGSLLQFGTGTIDPDPETLPGAEAALDKWSPSLEVMLRKAPETCLILAVASGVLLRRFAYHPITRLRSKPMEQRRLAEFFQVITQLISPEKVKVASHFTFAAPVRLSDLKAESQGRRIMPAIIERERQILRDHMQWVNSLVPSAG